MYFLQLALNIELALARQIAVSPVVTILSRLHD